MHSPLDLPIVQALSEHRTHPSLRASANAWLAAYGLARQLGFNETAALGQADTAWDRAAERTEAHLVSCLAATPGGRTL